MDGSRVSSGMKSRTTQEPKSRAKAEDAKPKKRLMRYKRPTEHKNVARARKVNVAGAFKAIFNDVLINSVEPGQAQLPKGLD